MSQIPAPLLSRHLGILVVVLSVLAAAGLAVAPFLGVWPLVAAIALVAVQQAFLALAILVIGRTGLAGRGRLAVAATLGAAGILLLDVVAEIVAVLVALLAPLPPSEVVIVAGVTLAALNALLLLLFGVVVLRARVVRPGVRLLPLVAALAVVAAGVAGIVDRPLGLLAGCVGAVLLSGGIGLALFTPRTLK